MPSIQDTWGNPYALGAPAVNRHRGAPPAAPMLAVGAGRRYNRAMRRSTRLGLVALVLLLAALGAYTAYWLIVAPRLNEGVTAWAQSLRGQGIDASWQRLRVTGFPFAFRVEIVGVRLRDNAMRPAPVLRLAALSGRASPWNLDNWQLTARQGLTAELAGIGDRLPARLVARHASGAVSVHPTGGATIWLVFDEASAEMGERASAKSADCWVILPAHPPHADTDQDFSVSALLHHVTLPAAPPGLGNMVDTLAFAATVRGPIPARPLRQAASAWRDAGGSIDLDNFRLRWGSLDITGSGTVALDQNLQPVGGFSGAIEGYDKLMAALVASGRIRPANAGLARLALAMLAKAGPDGKPEIATSFTIQNGEMYLGPANLGRAPRISWE